MASPSPRTIPWSERACRVYSEQEGINRQLAGKKGETNIWYARTKPISRLRIKNWIRNSTHTFLYLIQYWFEFPFHIRIVQVIDLNVSFGHSNNVHIGLDFLLMTTEELAQQTFHAVAVDSIADLLAHRRAKTNPGLVSLPCPDKKEKAWCMIPPSCMITSQILPTMCEAASPGIGITGRGMCHSLRLLLFGHSEQINS